jgi:hypothetical protein
VSASNAPRAGGWRFFLWWMLTFLGFPLGGLLAFVLVGSVEGVLSGALGGALAGAVIGAAQWLVLRRYLRVGPEWVGATALGVAIGDALGALLTGAGTGIGALLITGLATGVAVGLLQWGLVLRGRVLLVHHQRGLCVMGYSGLHETSNLCTGTVEKGARTAPSRAAIQRRFRDAPLPDPSC